MKHTDDIPIVLASISNLARVLRSSDDFARKEAEKLGLVRISGRFFRVPIRNVRAMYGDDVANALVEIERG